MLDDVEISLRLAAAIGYKFSTIHVTGDKVYVPQSLAGRRTPFRAFSYKDNSVIWSIAEQYDAFPMRSLPKHRVLGEWCSLVGSNESLVRYADTPKKAIALCVIARHEYDKRTK